MLYRTDAGVDNGTLEGRTDAAGALASDPALPAPRPDLPVTVERTHPEPLYPEPLMPWHSRATIVAIWDSGEKR